MAFERPSQPPSERQIARACSTLDAAAADLAAAPVWAHLQQQLGSLPPHCAVHCLRHMVIYGLGSLEQPGAVHIRYQLAAARLLAALLPLAAPAEAFDPVFTALDHAVLAHCSIQVGAVGSADEHWSWALDGKAWNDPCLRRLPAQLHSKEPPPPPPPP